MTARTITEYRIRVHRQGLSPFDHFRKTARGMRRLLVLLGPEPWRAYTEKGPDEPHCCLASDCGCAGATVREDSDARRKGVPPIERIEVSCRSVTTSAWVPVERIDAVTAEAVGA